MAQARSRIDMCSCHGRRFAARTRRACRRARSAHPQGIGSRRDPPRSSEGEALARGRIVPYMKRLDPRTRTGLLVGALAMFLALDVAFLVSLAGLPFTPLALGQAIIDVLPGFISIPLIETLQFWAKGLLVIGVVALFFIGGAIAGALAVSPSRRGAAVIGAVSAPWVIAVVLGALVAGQRIDLGTSVVDAAVGLAVNALALAYLAPASLDRS